MRYKNPRICVGLGGVSLVDACSVVTAVGAMCHSTKLHVLYDAEGPKVIPILKKCGAGQICLDFKLDDVPKTVGLRAAALFKNGVDMLTVHAGGGIDMMREAVEAALRAANPHARIWAVGLLTSIGVTEIERDFGQYGNNPTAEQIVLNRARMAVEAGVSDFVCSAEELKILRGDPDLLGLCTIVPGTRLLGQDVGGHKRTGTPGQAIRDRAGLIVLESAYLDSPDPAAVFKAYQAEIDGAIANELTA